MGLLRELGAGRGEASTKAIQVNTDYTENDSIAIRIRRYLVPPEHSIPFRVICALICVICVDLDCFLPLLTFATGNDAKWRLAEDFAREVMARL